jgi:hypothetical protein
MDKQKEKTLVAEAEKLLQELLDKNSLTFAQLQELSKKLQKVNSNNNKKMEENKKHLSKYVSDKPELKEYLEKDEQNKVILAKAAQKVLSKSQPKPTQNDTPKKENAKTPKGLFKVEKGNLIELFKEEEFKKNVDNLYAYFETLSKEKADVNEVPFFSMIFFPKDKIVYFYLKNKNIMNLSFSQVDYLCTPGNELFLDIDYFSMLENCELDKTRKYKENCIDMAKLETKIKEIPSLKENEIKIIYVNDDFNELKQNLKQSCEGLKDKVKSVITNNKDYFNGIFV